MPHESSRKEYGPHKYAEHDGTSDCKYGCGCWMGPSRSGGPDGLDPFGVCPGNPKDGKPLGPAGKYGPDYYQVVMNRFEDLKTRCRTAEDGRRAAEEKLKRVAPGALKLSERLHDALSLLAKVKEHFAGSGKLAKEIDKLQKPEESAGPQGPMES